ncbi:MAG: uracil-DNA glycosylase superfamily protein [Ilumatobacteraceae bacterium]|nr:uracil-DNA glycosylase superfamily protein [Ilumatobacteraceae bacterium]
MRGEALARDEFIENKATRNEHLLSPRFAPANIRERMQQAFDPPVTALNEWVVALRDDPRLPPDAGRTIPFFDPRGGGVEAKVLFLMQDPSEVATFTGFISPDNNDRSANNATLACQEAGLEPRDRVHWNIFPWWVNITTGGKPVDPSRPPQSYAAARPLAARLLGEMLVMLPALQVLMLLGNEAQAGFERLGAQREFSGRGITVLRGPSTSPQSWNNIDRADPQQRYRREIVIEKLTEAARLIA